MNSQQYESTRFGKRIRPIGARTISGSSSRMFTYSPHRHVAATPVRLRCGIGPERKPRRTERIPACSVNSAQKPTSRASRPSLETLNEARVRIALPLQVFLGSRVPPSQQTGERRLSLAPKAPRGRNQVNLRRVAVEMEILDSDLDEFADPCTGQEQRFDHESVRAAIPVGRLDQPIDLEAIKTGRRG